jgi:hypothetical protein
MSSHLGFIRDLTNISSHLPNYISQKKFLQLCVYSERDFLPRSQRKVKFVFVSSLKKDRTNSRAPGPRCPIYLCSAIKLRKKSIKWNDDIFTFSQKKSAGPASARLKVLQLFYPPLHRRALDPHLELQKSLKLRNVSGNVCSTQRRELPIWKEKRRNRFSPNNYTRWKSKKTKPLPFGLLVLLFPTLLVSVDGREIFGSMSSSLFILFSFHPWLYYSGLLGRVLTCHARLFRHVRNKIPVEKIPKWPIVSLWFSGRKWTQTHTQNQHVAHSWERRPQLAFSQQ